MDDGDYEIDILDTKGNIASKKFRRDVVKGIDIYHAVYGVIVTPDDKIVISLIGSPEGMPNLHAGKLGCTCATIKRSGESADQAMSRAIKNELYMDSAFEQISEEFLDIDNTKRLITFYIIRSELPTEYNRSGIEELFLLAKSEFQKILDESPEKITPPLKIFWSKHT